jgi:hypothetical protein
MYMNSVQFFSDMVGEASSGLRSDILEKSYLKLPSQVDGRRVGELMLEIEGESIPLGKNATLNVDLPNPSKIFIFCMAALADGLDGRISGEDSGQVELSKRFFEFGDHVLIVRSNSEFSRRLNAAIVERPCFFNSDFFEGGHGQVDYVDMASHAGIVGLFRKDNEYTWQREYRICIGAESQALNANGALEIDLGDISDISQIMPLKDFLASPIKIRRGQIEKVDGEYKHRYID